MEILFIRPGSLFAFVDSEGEFHADWQRCRREGETLTVLACTDTEPVGRGRIAAPRRLGLNPDTIQSAELFTPESRWEGTSAERAYGKLVEAWESTLPADVLAARKAGQADEAERTAAAEEAAQARAGEELERRCVELAEALSARTAPTVEAYRESEQSRLRGWMVRTWVDSWEGPDRGRLAPQTFKQGQGQMLVEGGDLVTLYEKPVYKENGPLRTLYLRLERGRNYRREETRKQIGVRWEASNSKDPLSLDSVRAASLPGLRALAEEHGVAIDFDAPVPAA